MDTLTPYEFVIICNTCVSPSKYGSLLLVPNMYTNNTRRKPVITPETMGTLFEDFLSKWLICVLVLLLEGVITSGDAALAGGVELKKVYIS